MSWHTLDGLSQMPINWKEANAGEGSRPIPIPSLSISDACHHGALKTDNHAGFTQKCMWGTGTREYKQRSMCGNHTYYKRSGTGAQQRPAPACVNKVTEVLTSPKAQAYTGLTTDYTLADHILAQIVAGQ